MRRDDFFGLAIALGGSMLALVQPAPVAALTADQIQQIATNITVLIDGINPGSGVLIGRSGQTYYVLTAGHVVATPDEYTLVTATGDRYPVSYGTVRRLAGVDLAVLSFTSSRRYETATLADYPYTSSFQNVFTAGWTANPNNPTQRSRRFSVGVLGDRTFTLAMTQGPASDGYTLFYSNVTDVGMSGGPVLDSDGRVIGIHGLAEGEEINQPTGGVTRVKRGFSAGIPISTFLRLLPQTGLNLALQAVRTPPQPVSLAQANSLQPYLTLPAQPSPLSAADWTNRGNQLYRLGRLQEALDVLDQAVQLDPMFHLAWYERGNVLFAMQSPIEAIAAYDRAIQLKPEFERAWRDLGVLLLETGQPVAALASFDRAVQLAPNDYVLWYMRGNLLNRDLRDYPAALESYRYALQVNPNFADAWTGQGKALHELGQYEAALAAYNRATQLEPDLAVAWILRSRTLMALGRSAEAITNLQTALRLKPNDPEALRMLAGLQPR